MRLGWAFQSLVSRTLPRLHGQKLSLHSSEWTSASWTGDVGLRRGSSVVVDIVQGRACSVAACGGGITRVACNWHRDTGGDSVARASGSKDPQSLSLMKSPANSSP